MARGRVIGLLVMTELPDYGLVAVLQKRGEFNHEKLEKILRDAPDKPESFFESYPGACQLTVWGGMKEGESPPEALMREGVEEIGDEALNMACDEVSLKQIYRFADGENLKVVYGVKLPCEFLTKIRLGPQSGGLRLFKEKDLPYVRDLKEFDRNEGVMDRGTTAMFADTKEAIEIAFKLAKNDPTN